MDTVASREGWEPTWLAPSYTHIACGAEMSLYAPGLSGPELEQELARAMERHEKTCNGDAP